MHSIYAAYNLEVVVFEGDFICRWWKDNDFLQLHARLASPEAIFYFQEQAVELPVTCDIRQTPKQFFFEIPMCRQYWAWGQTTDNLLLLLSKLTFDSE